MGTSERSLRGSWKLTFSTWSALLLLWSIVTVALDEDSLRLMRRMGVEGSDVATWVIAIAIGLPLTIDVTRNLQRTYRLWKRRAATTVEGADWRSRVPAYVPRRFRVGNGPVLTRRERSIVEQGQLIHGTVEHHGALTSVRATTPWGTVIASRPVNIDGERPREGAGSPLLFEAGAKVGVAPRLHDLRYFGAEAEDRRPPTLPAAVRTLDTRPVSVPVHASLHPVDRVSGARSTEVGELSYDGDQIVLLLEESDPSTVVLTRPFLVELAVHLLPDGRAELEVTLEQRTEGAYRAGAPHPLRFKTELDQRRLDRDLPLRWADVAYVEPEAFDRLWPRIAAHADDDAVTDKVSLA